MIHQLRIYEIFDENKALFHTRFRDHAARIMRRRIRHRSNVGSPHTAAHGIIYLLKWPDEHAKTAAWAAFMADPEWAEIKRVTRPAHGSLVGEIADRLLVPTDYSPALD